MVFYGTRATTLKQGQINNVTCPNCNAITSMSYAIFGKYAHIYWIPSIPLGKENVIECNSCKKTYKLNSLPDGIKKKFEFEKQGARIPIWYFSGLAIILTIIALITYSSFRDKENAAIYVQDPQVGDVYSLDYLGNGFYTTMKVTSISGDTIIVVYNDYETDRKSQISRIDISKNYTTSIDTLTKSDIQFYFREGSIFDADRD